MDGGIQKLAAFVKTAECGSFTKAAEALSYSQSGISRMVADLEREWGVSLLERGRGGVRLTSDGLRLLPHVEAVCAAHGELKRRVDELNGLEAGLIRIGTFSSVATHWLPNVVKAFQKDHPRIDYELLIGEYAEIEEWIAKGRVDCGFLRLPASADLDVLPLGGDELVAVLPLGHPLSTRDTVPLAELCAEPFMLLERGAKAEVSELLERYDVKPNVHFTTWDDYAIMSMVESGLGVGILPRLILKRAPYRIVTRSLDVEARRAIGIALRDRKSASVAVKTFLDYLPYRLGDAFGGNRGL